MSDESQVEKRRAFVAIHAQLFNEEIVRIKDAIAHASVGASFIDVPSGDEDEYGLFQEAARSVATELEPSVEEVTFHSYEWVGYHGEAGIGRFTLKPTIGFV